MKIEGKGTGSRIKAVENGQNVDKGRKTYYVNKGRSETEWDPGVDLCSNNRLFSSLIFKAILSENSEKNNNDGNF